MSLRIDSHQHFWHPARGDYFWMPPDDPVLTRPYGPEDLAPLRHVHGIEHSIVVQAAPSIHETEYLLGIANMTDSVAGVVGWVDFERQDDLAHLQRLVKHPKFKGVRPMIQDIPDDGWMLRADLQWAYKALIDLDLSFDALGFPRHLENFHTILTKYPDLRTVINHCMKPQIRSYPDGFEDWKLGMTRLAQDTNAFCKLSGIVTETDGGWRVEDLQPYVDHLFDAFGPERMMWGSDWPVCLLQASYGEWCDAAETLARDLSVSQRARLFGGTAVEFYRLNQVG